MHMITTCMRAGHAFRSLAIVIIMAAVGLVSSATAQSLRTVSYQGLLKNGTTPYSGVVTLAISYYEAGSSTALMTETFPEVNVTGGTFGVLLGSRLGGLPESIDFSQPIEIGVSVNGAAELPHTLLTAVPYAFAAHTLDGLLASPTPQNNRIFPLPVDAFGHIGASVLPTVSINGVNAVNNNLKLTAGQNVTLTPDYANNQLLISTAVGSISSVTVGQGLIGGGTTGPVNVSLNPGQVPGNWLSPGSVTGHQLNAAIAGPGLQMDVEGNLGLLVDAANFNLTGGELHLRHDVPVFGPSGAFDMLTGRSAVLGDGWESTVTIDGPTFVHSPMDMGYNPIHSLSDPWYSSDAATKSYVDNQVAQRPWLDQGEILVGNTDNIASNRVMSGDATIDWTGQVTVRGLQGYSIVNNAPSSGDVLQFVSGEGSYWVPATLMLNGDVTGSRSANTVSALQGIPLWGSQPAGGAFLRYDAGENAWIPQTITYGQVNTVQPGTGISVNAADAQNPVVSITPFTQTGQAGSVNVQAGYTGQDHMQATVFNSLVNANSIIMLTVEMNGNSTQTRHYIPYLTAVGSGSFTVNVHEASSNLFDNEGVTVNYVIFN